MLCYINIIGKMFYFNSILMQEQVVSNQLWKEESFYNKSAPVWLFNACVSNLTKVKKLPSQPSQALVRKTSSPCCPLRVRRTETAEGQKAQPRGRNISAGQILSGTKRIWVCLKSVVQRNSTPSSSPSKATPAISNSSETLLFLWYWVAAQDY